MLIPHVGQSAREGRGAQRALGRGTCQCSACQWLCRRTTAKRRERRADRTPRGRATRSRVLSACWLLGGKGLPQAGGWQKVEEAGGEELASKFIDEGATSGDAGQDIEQTRTVAFVQHLCARAAEHSAIHSCSLRQSLVLMATVHPRKAGCHDRKDSPT